MTDNMTYGPIENNVTAVGAAATFLARKPPFSTLDARSFIGSVQGQIQRNHCIFAISDRTIQGYFGWCMGTDSEGLAFANGDTSAGFHNLDSGEAVILSFVASENPRVIAEMAAELRKLYPRKNLYGRRFKNDKFRALRVLL